MRKHPVATYALTYAYARVSTRFPERVSLGPGTRTRTRARTRAHQPPSIAFAFDSLSASTRRWIHTRTHPTFSLFIFLPLPSPLSLSLFPPLYGYAIPIYACTRRRARASARHVPPLVHNVRECVSVGKRPPLAHRGLT